MPRKGHTQKRDVLADPLYNNKVVTKLINNIMLDGKKGVAQKIVYGAFDRVAAESGKEAVEVFEEAMNNIMPVLEVKAKRIGGATYQVPIEVKPERRQALALRWITLYSRKRGEKTQEERLAKEILDADFLSSIPIACTQKFSPENITFPKTKSVIFPILKFFYFSSTQIDFFVG